MMDKITKGRLAYKIDAKSTLLGLEYGITYRFKYDYYNYTKLYYSAKNLNKSGADGVFMVTLDQQAGAILITRSYTDKSKPLSM